MYTNTHSASNAGEAAVDVLWAVIVKRKRTEGRAKTLELAVIAFFYVLSL